MGCRVWPERRGAAGWGRVRVLLLCALAAHTGQGDASANLGPQDMAAMMQGMASMMKLWNAFSSGSGTDFSGAFSPRSAFDSGSWVDPWGSSAWSSVPGLAGGGWSGPWSGMPSIPGGGWPMSGAVPGAGWPMPGTGMPGGGWPMTGGVPGGGWPMTGGVPAGSARVPGLQVPGAPWSRPARTVTPVEGKWQGANGEWLEFRSDRFRLAAPEGGALAGSFLVHGDRLVAYVAEANVTRLYQFEVRGDYLALKDEAGQLLLFRRAP